MLTNIQIWFLIKEGKWFYYFLNVKGWEGYYSHE